VALVHLETILVPVFLDYRATAINTLFFIITNKR